MDKVIEFFTNNGAALTALIVAALMFISKVTPTPKDDEWVSMILFKLNLLPESARLEYEAKKAAKGK